MPVPYRPPKTLKERKPLTDYAAPDPFEAQPQASAPDRPVSQDPLAGRPDGWVNLQEWMGLNAEQGDQMAKRVSGGVEQRAQAAKSALDASRRDFESRVNEGG